MNGFETHHPSSTQRTLFGLRLCDALTGDGAGVGAAGDHLDQPLPQPGHDHAVDQQVGGGVQCQHHMGDEAKDDAPDGKPSKICFNATTREFYYVKHNQK